MIPIEQLRDDAKIRGAHGQDDYLLTLEQCAVEFAQQRLGFYIGEEQNHTQYVEGSGIQRLWLSDDPVEDITSIVERGVPGADGREIAAADSDGFLVRGRCLVRKNGLAWTRGYEYEVEYRRGYETLDAPSPTNLPPSNVQKIVKTLVTFWYERRVPLPRIGEVHTFPVPNHLETMIISARRGRV